MPPWLTRLLPKLRAQNRLRTFAETEAFGGADLTRAAGQVDDPWVRRQLVRHAEDEARHAKLLGEAAGEAAPVPLGTALSGGAVPTAGVDIGALGEVGFLAFVHVSEANAAEEFATVKAGDVANAEMYDSILADERRHVAWTAHALDRFRAAGRGPEVDAALRSVRRNRRLLPLRWLLGRFADLSAGLVLSVLYYAALWPFVLLAPRPKSGWQEASPLDLRTEF